MKKIIYFLFFISSFIQGQNEVKVDLRNPNSTLYTHIYFLMPDHYDLNKASAVIRGLPKAEAEDKAIKLKKILSGNGLLIDFAKVPTNPNYIDTVNFGMRTLEENKHRYVPFPVRLPEVYVEKTGSRWYYSVETLSNIDALYKKTFPVDLTKLNEKFPQFFQKKLLSIYIWKPVFALLFLVICVILYYVLEPLFFLVLKLLQKYFFKGRITPHSFKILHELAAPMVLLVIVRFLRFALPLLQLGDWNQYLVTGLKIAETIFWIFVALRLAKIMLHYYYEREGVSRSRLDKQLAPILSKLIQGLIVLIGALNILTVFGVDPTTVLTGASIGGIAFAFAAQDSVKNFIGTVVIFMDKPFQINDWVSFGSVEGAVEKVGFRSTIIRAADTTIFQVPNSKISEADINNIGLRIYRRYKTELGIRYDTPPALIEAFIAGIKEIITLHPSTKSQAYNVDFIAFGDSSLNILVNVYFKGLDWGQEQESKHILHMGILKLAETLGVQFAFPSSTLMIEEFPGQASIAPKYETKKAEVKAKVEKNMDEFENKDHTMDPNASRERGG
jgi:MscS family membrane protein